MEDGSETWVEERLADMTRWALLETELVRVVAHRMSDSEVSISASAGEVEERESHPERTEAYEIFIRARYEWQSLERHRMQDALQQLLRAIEIDPGLVAARVDLAYLAITHALGGFMPPAIATDAVRRATEGITDVAARAEAMLPALGWVSFYFDRDLPAALRAFARSAHLPHDPWITRTRTVFALGRHRFSEAIDLLQSALRVDPWSIWAPARLAWAYHLAGDSAASVPLAHTALERFPEQEGAQLYGSAILAFNGEAGRAIEVAREFAQRQSYFDPAAAVHAYALAMAGRTDEAHAILERLQWLSRERYTMNTFASAAYVALGEFDQAIEVLHASDQVRCPWFFQMLADPRLKPLQQRPEFQSMQGILTGMEADARRNAMEE
jgi:tetratricopeptide (TPR) repeat protein